MNKDILVLVNLINEQLKRYQQARIADYVPNGLHLELDIKDCLYLIGLKRRLENYKEA